METEISQNGDLEKCGVALILIDVINDLEWPGGDRILKSALQMAENIEKLAARARRAGVPVIYVNDNFGRWRSDFRHLVEHCLRDGVRGKPLAEKLQPRPEDYFVLKPRHSGFHGSCLDILLRSLEARTLVLAGLAGNLCVLYTANDAYMRGYDLIVPWDGVASNSLKENEQALDQMRLFEGVHPFHPRDPFREADRKNNVIGSACIASSETCSAGERSAAGAGVIQAKDFFPGGFNRFRWMMLRGDSALPHSSSSKLRKRASDA